MSGQVVIFSPQGIPIHTFKEGRTAKFESSDHLYVYARDKRIVGIVVTAPGMFCEVYPLDEPKAPAEPEDKPLPKFHGPDWQKQQTNETPVVAEPVCICKPGFWNENCLVAHGDETGEHWDVPDENARPDAR
jgi:hypothetical protein